MPAPEYAHVQLPPPENQLPIVLSIPEMARILNKAPNTIRAWLNGVPPAMMRGKARCYPLWDVIESQYGGVSLEGDNARQRLDLNAERARLAKEQADGHAMKNAVQAGEIAPKEYFDRVALAIGHDLAQILELIPIEIKRQLPHLDDTTHEAIERVVADARNRFASGLEHTSRELGFDPISNSGSDSDATADPPQPMD